MRRLQCVFIEQRTIPFVELDADVPLDPGTVILLPNRHEDVIGFHEHVRFTAGFVTQSSIIALHGFDTLENHAFEAAVFVHELLRRTVVDDGDAFVHGIFLLPVRRFHNLEGRADHHAYRLCTQPLRGAAAVHCGVSATHHDDFAFDLVCMFKRHTRQPVDAD